MFSYLLNRWRFNRQFQPDGDGFVYRRNARSEAYQVTMEERDAFVRQFRKRYWKYHLSLIGAWIVILALTVIIMMWVTNEADPRLETAALAVGYVSTAALIIGVFVIDHRLFNGPTIALAERKPIAPKRSWTDTMDEALLRMSWVRLAVSGIILAYLTWATVPPQEAKWERAIFPIFFGALFLLNARNSWRKYQITRAL